MLARKIRPDDFQAGPDRADRRMPIGAGTHRRAERIMEICESMIDICAALFDVPSKELRHTGRTTVGISRVRQIAMYVTHTTLRISMGEVGRGYARDRTTVRHACHMIEDMRDDEDFDNAVMMTERVALAAFRNWLET